MRDSEIIGDAETGVRSAVECRAGPSQRLRVLMGEWTPLPDWARFFVELGSAIGAATEGQSRLVSAVATPTRAYAAALSAAGVVLTRLAAGNPLDAAEHFKHLQSLLRGTTVTCRRKSQIETGWLQGCASAGGTEYVVVQFRGYTSKIAKARSLSIEPALKVADALAGPRKRSIVPTPKVLTALIGPGADSQLSHSRLECGLVGNGVLLREEIMGTPVAVVDDDATICTGQLQDLVRVRQSSGTFDCFRAELFSASAKPTRAAASLRPTVVVFDGSRAFMNYSHVWNDANWIAILNREDARFADAAAEINRLYATRKSSPSPGATPLPPKEMDHVTFELPRGSR